MSTVQAKSVVLEILRKLELPDSHYWKVWDSVVNVYRSINLHHAHFPRIKKEVMDNNRIIYYPSDMVELIKCYVPYQGKLEELTPTNIVPTVSQQMGMVVRNVEDGEGEAIHVGHRGMKSKPQNPFGYYYDYKKERYIAFLVQDRSEVMLAYKTSGLTSDDTLIPVELKNALLWGVIYEEVLLSRNTMWRTQEVKRMYDDALALVRKPSVNMKALVEAWVGGATLNRY